MIPQKLTVRNFMCYREDVPPLHFDGISVVCLSGENGAGKSALLDAMTWALWGRARAKSDDELIALGQDEMEVDFEFVLDGTRRRVVRRRTRGKRGHTIVDFQVCDENGAWRRVSGDGVRDTDAQIADALRMKYDTFINSAFLLQGRADEFTNRKPAERKQVLADILGLAEYERLEERAKIRRSQCDEELRSLEGLIADHEAQVASRPFFAARLDEAAELGSRLDRDVASREEAVQRLREAASHLRQLADAQIALDLQIARHAKDLQELQQEAATIRMRVEKADSIVARRPEIEAGVARLSQIEERLNEFEVLREEAYRLNDEKKQYDDAVREMRLELEHEQRAASDDLGALRERATSRVALQVTLDALEVEAASYAQLRAELGQLRNEQTALEERQQQINDLRHQKAELQRPLEQMRTSRLSDQSHLVQAVRLLESNIATMPEVERELEALRVELAQLQEVERQMVTRRDQLRADETERANLREQSATLEKSGKEIAQKLQLIETGTSVCPVCEQPLDEAGHARLAVEYRTQRDTRRAEYAALRKAAGQLDTQIAQGEAELRHLEQLLAGRARLEPRRATLEANLARMQADAARLREQQANLDTIERQLAAEDYGHAERAQLHAVDEALAALGALADVKRVLERVRRSVGEIERRLAGELDLHQRIASVQEKIRGASEAETHIPALQARLEAVTRRLDNEEYGEAERAASEELLVRIKALGYTRVEHDRLRAELSGLQGWRQKLLELEHAEQSLGDNRLALERSRELIERRGADLEREREELSSFEVQLRGRRAIEQELGEAERGLQTLRARQKVAHEELGSAKRDLDRCDEVAALLVGYHAQQVGLLEQRAIYDELLQAFGKKGIQAMLIDHAIPELEHAANELLTRMTDNQMHLSFETQRDSKKGDTLETLDIRIADGLGTRDYAMFSGGEAFRVNFAIRVALSKLLARRANANLKTLVMDEGFGTQDGQGRDRIVEAINAVSPDFERILVITHIQELKDLFPNQIEVTKGPTGSTWTVV